MTTATRQRSTKDGRADGSKGSGSGGKVRVTSKYDDWKGKWRTGGDEALKAEAVRKLEEVCVEALKGGEINEWQKGAERDAAKTLSDLGRLPPKALKIDLLEYKAAHIREKLEKAKAAAGKEVKHLFRPIPAGKGKGDPNKEKLQEKKQTAPSEGSRRR